MNNWLRRALLSRVYRKIIKQNSLADFKRSSKKLKKISVILDHRLGIDKEHFKKSVTILIFQEKNLRVLTFFNPKIKSMKLIKITVVPPKIFQVLDC